jgi:fatty acid-binding protein DegV
MPIETLFYEDARGRWRHHGAGQYIAFIEAFEPVLQSGDDISISAFPPKLFRTVQSANSAAEELKAKYPERKVIVIDSCSASLGEGLLVYYAARKQSLGLGELAHGWRENKLRFVHWFTVDDLVYLKRGGASAEPPPPSRPSSTSSPSCTWITKAISSR